MSELIHEFDPLLYPTRVWAGVNVPSEDIAQKFYSLLTDGSVADFEDTASSSSVATCYPVVDKESKRKGIFCNIHRPKDTGVGVMSHEAEHIVCWICEQFGINSISFDDSEPRAYLIQWAANCLNEVKSKKK